MDVRIHLEDSCEPIDHFDVKNTYTSDGLYCVVQIVDAESGRHRTHKYPILKVARILEEDTFVTVKWVVRDD